MRRRGQTPLPTSRRRVALYPRHVSHYRDLEPVPDGGGMSRVFKAVDEELGRPVALKFLAPALSDNTAAIERFRREARMLAQLEHGNICHVHEIARDDDGNWFIAMAWYEGKTVKQLLREGPLPRRLVLEIAIQTAEGLGYAHANGIVHRDVKPANLIVTELDTDRPVVKILDFGVARLLHGPGYTVTGALVGTAGYLAPEQTRDDEITAAADIWSLGVVLYEMCARRLPFGGDSVAAQLYAIANDEPATLPPEALAYGPDLGAIIDRCLVKEPADRFPSADVLARALAAAQAGDADTVMEHTRPQGAPTGRPRRLLYASLGAAVTLVVAVLALTFGWSPLSSSPDRSGVAVLPFAIEGSDGPETALGHGLAAHVNDRLLEVDAAADGYWAATFADVLANEVGDPDDARDILGAHRVVMGTGRRAGDEIELRLVVAGAGSGEPVEREFRDAAANLRTWQDGLATWVAHELDPALAPALPAERAPGGTTVPAAFLDYCEGRGLLLLADSPPSAEQLARIEAVQARAVGADSSFARARGELGYVQWLRSGRDEAGREHLAAAVRIDSTLARGYAHLAAVAADDGDRAAAAAIYERGLRAVPDHPLLLSGYVNLARATGDSTTATRLLARGIAARPGYAGSHYRRVYHLIQTGRFDAAEVAVGELISLAPRDVRGYMALGHAHWGNGEFELAERRFRQAVALKRSAYAYALLGTLFYYQARYEDAVRPYAMATQLAPDQREYWAYLGEAQRWAHGRDASLDAYRRAIALGEEELAQAPRDVRMIAQLASWHALMGNRERALELLARLESLPAPSGDIAMTVADAWEQLGRRDEAFRYLERGLATGLAPVQIEEYPGFRNLRSTARYRELMDRTP